MSVAELARIVHTDDLKERVNLLFQNFDLYEQEFNWGVGTLDDETEVWVSGDWNPDFSSRVGDLLEAWGVETYWLDEVSTCDDCYKLVQTSPSSYHWQPEWIVANGSIVCLQCLDYDDDLLDEYVNNPHNALPYPVAKAFDLIGNGWEQVGDTYESGAFSGMTDDPKVIYERERKFHDQVVFVIPEVSQFYLKFEVYVRDNEEDE